MQEHILSRFSVPETVTCLRCTPDGAFCVAGSGTGKLYIWQASRAARLTCFHHGCCLVWRSVHSLIFKYHTILRARKVMVWLSLGCHGLAPARRLQRALSPHRGGTVHGRRISLCHRRGRCRCSRLAPRLVRSTAVIPPPLPSLSISFTLC